MLVHWPEWQKYYYFVPFGWEKDGSARGWFVINAYDGNFQEVGGYRTKFLCLSKEEAIKIALNALRETGVEKYEIIKAELIFKYSEQAYGRQFPLWQVTIDRLLPLYVGQDGKVYWELTPPPC